MPRVKKSSKRRPRSDDPEWSAGAVDYPDDESSGMFSLDNLVESWYQKQKTTTVVLPDAVEMQLNDSIHSGMEEEDDDSYYAPPAPPLPSATRAVQDCSSVDEEGETKNQPQRRLCTRYMVGGVLLALVCIAAIVVVSVIAPSKNEPTVSSNVFGDGQDTTTGDDGIVQAPPPADDGPVLSREEAFAKIAQGLSTEESLNTPESPQSKALEWLIDYDAAKLDPNTQNQREVEERYILAVFYYATGGSNWFDSFYFLSQNHICNWKNLDFGMGVQCEDGRPMVNGFKFGKSTSVLMFC